MSSRQIRRRSRKSISLFPCIYTAYLMHFPYRFRTRFQHIVELEKDNNFISRLHDSRLTIIPWPVIESAEFYRLFWPLGTILREHPITHTQGAIFLETMKTLMAKLKVCAHRPSLSFVLRPIQGERLECIGSSVSQFS